MRARTLAVICIVTGWACSEPLAPEPPGSFAALSAGHQHTCGLQRDGTAYCWGRNAEGQIGTTQTDAYYPLPQVVSTELKFSQIAAGYGHTCALTADGVAYCWGSNFSGELGRATVPSSRIPVPVDGGLTFTALAVGQTHSCGLTAAGAAYCWGNNNWGQIGHDTSALRVGVPIAVAGGHMFATIAAGGASTCGIESDGSAYCWGYNDTGALGSGDTARAIGVPVAVAGGLKFKSISAGSLHACGVTTSNGVYCWGQSNDGALGIGRASGNYRTPQRTHSDRSFTTVSVGGQHSCALDLDGALMCWGFDFSDQLGGAARDQCDGVPCALTPIAAARNHYFQALTTGAAYSCGLAFNGAAFCWGENGDGQIGNGRVEVTTPSPSRVADPP